MVGCGPGVDAGWWPLTTLMVGTAGSETRGLDERWYDETSAGHDRTPRRCWQQAGRTRAYQARQPGHSSYSRPSDSPYAFTGPSLHLGQARRPAALTSSSPIHGKPSMKRVGASPPVHVQARVHGGCDDNGPPVLEHPPRNSKPTLNYWRLCHARIVSNVSDWLRHR